MRSAAAALLEIVVLLAAAAALGLGVNEVRSDRLSLSRDYFKTDIGRAGPRPGNGQGQAGAPDGQRAGDAPEHGFQTVSVQEALRIFNDPMYEVGLFVFIDARDEDHYLEGHVPGAYQLDHYRLEQYLPEVLPVAMGADRLVVYCNGGECEDSLLVSVDLLDQGVAHERLYLFEGGIKEWRAKGGPIAEGEEE